MTIKLHLDFLVLGAQKAGTTSLHDWLTQHDDIRLPTFKETHFFSHDTPFTKGLDWYLEQFPEKKSSRVLTGEIDPEYLFSSFAPERIKKLTDVGKFVVILRHPIERAYSQYLMSVRRGFENLPFDQALQSEGARLKSNGAFAQAHHSYMARSLYAEQIQRYLDLFQEAEFLFIKFDDFVDKKKGKDVYASICEFVGSSYDVNLVDRSSSSNKASTPRWSWLRNLIYRKGDKSLLRKAVGAIINYDVKLKLFLYLDKINQRNLKKEEIKPVTDYCVDDKTVSKLLYDLEKTMRITGLPLQDWYGSISNLKTRNKNDT